MHETAPEVQLPEPLQVSPLVQAFPSLHALPFGRALKPHAPLARQVARSLHSSCDPVGGGHVLEEEQQRPSRHWFELQLPLLEQVAPPG